MSNPGKLIIKIVGALVALGVLGFIAIQFVPVDKSNPPVVSEPKWDSPQTQALAERACFDCHSNQTKWPWYSNVAPASWLVAHDVEEGRSKLNFSDIGLAQNEGKATGGEAGEAGEAYEEGEGGEGGEGRQSAEGGEGVEVDEVVEEIEDGAMPPRSYVMMHPDAKLSRTEIEALITGLKATFGTQTTGAMTK